MNTANTNHSDREHLGTCEECSDELPSTPLEAEGLKFCCDACLVRWLGLASREWGCGAFMGSVEGGEVRS